ncbi:precorrin-2 dehydrogenase/sirohydrochlorin ferrochelatase family protein [Paenibacillus apis]|uniref:precorrin-2 dehydrogenase n=2 Tax=Paenibacillus TaxID=44249 RepID=A0A919Y2C2_9BACL|nr:bifunctional precorrin-2 dehydrogenase/sirohydrochlorin ferrochelatase [Paenibacillus apis]GIO43581.1 siroheme synthase [Paenibacillus apis]
MQTYVPLMMKVSGRSCIIIGGGLVAERKALSLLDADAKVRIVSPATSERLHRLFLEGALEWIQRGYREGDLEGAFLAYAATDTPEINDAVVEEANRLGIPVNHAGDGGRGSFITPSVLRRGKLVLSVSASGSGPAAASRLCREIDEVYGDDYELYLDAMAMARTLVKAQVRDPHRRSVLLGVVRDMDMLAQIRQGTFTPWSEEEWMNWIEAYREDDEA